MYAYFTGQYYWTITVNNVINMFEYKATNKKVQHQMICMRLLFMDICRSHFHDTLLGWKKDNGNHD